MKTTTYTFSFRVLFCWIGLVAALSALTIHLTTTMNQEIQQIPHIITGEGLISAYWILLLAPLLGITLNALDPRRHTSFRFIFRFSIFALFMLLYVQNTPEHLGNAALVIAFFAGWIGYRHGRYNLGFHRCTEQLLFHLLSAILPFLCIYGVAIALELFVLSLFLCYPSYLFWYLVGPMVNSRLQ
jgi:hypothetical protein